VVLRGPPSQRAPPAAACHSVHTPSLRSPPRPPSSPRAAGYNFWDWEDRRVHYIAAGPASGPPVLLIHGYGASAYHWRYQIPQLAAAGYRVYAMCLLGFGWSSKATDAEYSGGRLWSRQIADFITQVGAAAGAAGAQGALAPAGGLREGGGAAAAGHGARAL